MLYAILDAARVAHVGITGPFVVPVAFARDGERVLVHGSAASRLFRTMVAGARCCLTVTLLDGLVLARSAFESSMNYRSVMVLGEARAVDGRAKLAALETLSEHLLPGRWAQVRPPSAKELAATLVAELPLTECSVKVSAGWPTDADDDLALDIWAGVVPIREVLGAAAAAPDLRPGIPVPSYVDGWR